MDDCPVCRVECVHSALHTGQSSIQNNKYKVSHKYSCFSWSWAHSRPKHVEKRNKHTKKSVHQVGFIYKIKQKGSFVTFPYKHLYVLSANRFQTWISVYSFKWTCHRCSVSDSLSAWSLPPTSLSVHLLKKKRHLQCCKPKWWWWRCGCDCVYLDDV